MATQVTGAGGTTTSFSNTPQAKDDLLAFSEDATGVLILNVLANDLGGTAKQLYSIDNADSLTTATKIYAPADLLARDITFSSDSAALAALPATANTSLLGARIWISADGTIHYNKADIDAQVQALGQGQVLTDKVTYAIQLGNGTLSWATATIQFTGTNDAAVITGASTASLTETDAVLTASGQLSATDVDSSNAFVAQSAVAGSHGYGTFAVDATGAWTYTTDPSAHNEFVGGTTYTDSFTVATADGTTQVVTVSILGTNDAAVITGASTASLTETDAVLTASGQLSATDVDSSNAFVAQSAVAGSHGYGTFAVDATGAWTYTTDPSAHNEFVGGTTYTDSFTVATADGTTQVVTVSILGTNDAAVITGASTASLTETDAVLTASGQLSATDVDSSNAFVAQSAVAGSHGYGTFAVDATGAWTYTTDPSAHNEFVGGTTYTDSFTVATADGTTQVVTVSILGTNDAAVITGASTASLTETDAVLTASGQLSATDVDSSNAFVAQSAVAGSHGYGTFAVDATGAWTYTTDPSAHNEFVGGTTYTDSFTVATADGTTQVVTVSILGTNDAAVITGASTASLTETDAVLTASGQLSATDVDSSNAFVAQSAVAGSHGYGTFAVDATGAWTYTTDPSAHNEFVGGTTYTDSFTVATADGTTQVVTVSILGTNDAAVITGASTASLTETDAVLTASGQLSATDVDSSNAFVAQSAVAGSHGYGTFAVDATGAWTYTTDPSAHNEFVGGTTYTDSFTVATADGTTQVVTVSILGTNDAAVITGASTASLTETDAVLTASGQLSATDVDSSNAFVAQSAVAGSHGYGTFAVDATGAWTYTTDPSAHNEFVGGTTYTDSFTVATADGTTQVVTVSILGTNDAAVITGASTASLTETDAVLTASGQLSATDVDSSNAFVAQSAVAGSHGYGTFAVDATGAWTYTTDPSAHNEFVGGTTYTDSFTVATADGTTQVVTVSILGTNDAAVITGEAAGTVVEAGASNGGGTPTATGDLLSTDVDNATDSFQAVNSATASAFGYGTYTVTAAGVWTYALDNLNPTVNALNDGQPLSDSFTVFSEDGTAKLVSITINGADDAAPRFAPTDIQLTPSTTTDNVSFGSFQFAGTLTATDPDPGSFVYSITSQSDSGLFSITGSTLSSGNLSPSKTFSVTVQATQVGDPAGPAYQYSETFHVITGSNGVGAGETFNDPSNNNGDDVLYGNGGADQIFGLAGNDTLFGQGGNDTLNGGDGNDRLVGGVGADTLTGGTGSDTFYYGPTVTDSAPGVGNFDTITDFAHNVDKIDLSSIDANTVSGGDQAFLFGGSNANTVANSITWSESGGNTIVHVDINGNTTADFQITLTGIGLGLTASDFIL